MSSKRVIDGVPMHLNHYLLHRFCSHLEELAVSFVAGLPEGSSSGSSKAANAAAAGTADGDDTDDVAAEADQVGGTTAKLTAAALMAEDKSTATKRAGLERQLKQLHEVRKILSVF